MNLSDHLNLVVLAGGSSAEREVSLRSGAAVAEALRSLGHGVHELDPKDRRFDLPEDTDAVFLALHGTYGEDGTVQAELDQLNVPYTGCDAEASRLAFDKLLTKQRCLDAGVPTARFLTLNSPNARWPRGWNPPVVVKPVRQGSSVGLQFVERVSDWSAALAESLLFDTEVLVEERISGRETTVAILDGAALPIVEVRPRNGMYDFLSKYTPAATEYFCPAPFATATTERIHAAALGAFHAVRGRDYARVDVMVRENGDPVVLELNTLPGMTETSLFPKAAAIAGISFPALCQRMVDLALARSRILKS